MNNLIFRILVLPLAAWLLSSCIEDGYATSPSQQPSFSVDTLQMGIHFTLRPTPTYRFTVRNRCSKILSLSHVALRRGNDFRINVDGIAGREFSDVEIRPGDSIFVFVEATLPQVASSVPAPVDDHIDFTANGVTSTVVVRAMGQNVRPLNALLVDTDMTLDAQLPWQVFDSIVVAKNATLTLAPGTRLCFHDKASMRVYGTLRSEGDTENPVHLSGDRTDCVVADISFDLMSGQWQGLWFAPQSQGNLLSHTHVRNTLSGVEVDSLAQATFINCRLRNSASTALSGYHATITAAGCEIAEAAVSPLWLHGGQAEINHCTIANYYLFSAIRGASVAFTHTGIGTDTDGSDMPYARAEIANSIIYGLGTDLSAPDLTGSGIFLRRCLIKSPGTDDDNFIDCIYDTDPLYFTIREDYIFDYRLRPGSPAATEAYPQLTSPLTPADHYGTPRSTSAPSLGAYEYLEPEVE